MFPGAATWRLSMLLWEVSYEGRSRRVHWMRNALHDLAFARPGSPFWRRGPVRSEGRARTHHGTLCRTARRARDFGREVRRLSFHADPAVYLWPVCAGIVADGA